VFSTKEAKKNSATNNLDFNDNNNYVMNAMTVFYKNKKITILF